MPLLFRKSNMNKLSEAASADISIILSENKTLNQVLGENDSG